MDMYKIHQSWTKLTCIWNDAFFKLYDLLEKLITICKYYYYYIISNIKVEIYMYERQLFKPAANPGEQ